jgi:hypothetical protein
MIDLCFTALGKFRQRNQNPMKVSQIVQLTGFEQISFSDLEVVAAAIQK